MILNVPVEDEGGCVMADGGFVVKIDGKEVGACYAVTLDYDKGCYRLNNAKPRGLPAKAQKITIEIVREE